MFKALGQRADGSRKLAVHRIARPRRWGGVVRLIKDQQRASAELTQEVAKAGV